MKANFKIKKTDESNQSTAISNENTDVSQKYIEDIEHICRYQLDADEIYDETLEVANMQYSNSTE